jgi:gamma-aminobutyric acid type B receptor
VAELDALSIEVVETQSFARDPGEAVRKLRDKDVRIILGNFNETWARRVLCEAHRYKLVGRKHQWLLMGTYRYGYYKPQVYCMTKYNC